MAGFGIQTLIVALVLGGVVVVVAWKRPFVVLAALILLVPFRDLSSRWMNASTDLSPDWAGHPIYSKIRAKYGKPSSPR